jgi:tetratricopeptide (TPR) repeat protein
MMQFMAERFLYLPMVGFSLGCASVIARMEKANRSLAFWISIAVILGGGALTINRVQIWKNEKVLYEATAKDSDYKAIRPYYNFISALMDEGDYAKALPHARRIWQENSKSPVLTSTQKGDMARTLGMAYLNSGAPDSGLVMIRNAVELAPANRDNLQFLGITYSKMNYPDSALAVFRRGAIAFPTEPRFEYDKGVVLLQTKRIPEARIAFSKSLATDPSFQPANDALIQLQRLPGDSLR